MKYKIILADPPWSYENENTGGNMCSGSKAKYPTMSLEEIKSVDIASISDKNCVLFLWTTTPLAQEGFEVMKAWGFKYKTTIYWRKIMSLGMGFWFRGQVETLLVGIKGKVKAFRSQRPNFIQSKAGRHSQKPYEMYGLIEEIAKKHDLYPMIELFARHKREGWSALGNQVPKEEQRLLRC